MIQYVTQVRDILHFKGHQNHIIGSKITAILLKGLILPIGEVISGRVCEQPLKQACFQREENYIMNLLYL